MDCYGTRASSGCESWIRQPFNASNYEQVAGRIATMLFDIDDPAMNAQNAKGIRLEDLKLEPKRVIAALCDWMNIKHEDSLYEMTAQNKNGGAIKVPLRLTLRSV